MMPIRRGFLLALVLVAACHDEQTPASPDAGAYDGNPATCQPEALGAPLTVTLGEARSYPATFILADGGPVAVTAGARGQGYEITAFAANAESRGNSFTVLAGEPSQAKLSLAAAHSVLAIAEVANESTGNHRPFCRLSLVQLNEKQLVQPAMHVSDATEDESIVHEAQSCEVVSAETGFVVAWQQHTSRDSDESGLFAQRIGLDGALRGERMTLLEKTTGKQADLALASDGMRALVAYRGADQSETTLVFIEQDALAKQALPGVDSPIRTFAAAHGGFVLRTFSSLWLLDAQGHVTHGPRALDAQAMVAPLVDSYVTIDREEYLVARALDLTLSRSSEPLGLSEDRDAQAQAVLFEPDGENTSVIFSDGESLKLVKLGCGAAPGSLGPKTCARVANLEPLDPGCNAEVCHVVMRFDYLTLGVRGWTVSSGARQPVDASQAERAAKTVFDANSEYLVNSLHVSGPSAGLFYVLHDPSDFGGFALVSEQSGAVVAAGGIVWSGRGSFWVPDSWRPAADIQCGETRAAPSDKVLEGESCADSGTTPAEALSTALSTNLAQGLAAKGAFTARTYLYMPSVGTCDPRVAEWLVILSQ